MLYKDTFHSSSIEIITNVYHTLRTNTPLADNVVSAGGRQAHDDLYSDTDAHFFVSTHVFVE